VIDGLSPGGTVEPSVMRRMQSFSMDTILVHPEGAEDFGIGILACSDGLAAPCRIISEAALINMLLSNNTLILAEIWLLNSTELPNCLKSHDGTFVMFVMFNTCYS